MDRGYWKREPRMCPNCGREMVFGDLDVSGREGAVLEWKSRAKYALSEKTIFGKQKTVFRPIRHRLLDTFSEDLFDVYAWYCPNCGIIDVRFRTDPVKIIAAAEADHGTSAE